MRLRWNNAVISAFLLTLPVSVLGEDILKSNGFSMCMNNDDFKVEKMDVSYDKATSKVVFNVAGTSNRAQEVTASLTVTAYGQQVYKKEFDPCDEATKVQQLCPVPSGHYEAAGSQDVPAEFAKQIPAIAFNVPDLDGIAKLELKAKDSGAQVACIQSDIGNGKTMSTKAVPIIAAGIAGAALLVSGLSSLAAGGHPGTTTPSPSFMDVMTWFQGIAMNGMLSVNYPPLYRSFTKNFAFSGFLIPWDSMETTIDNFREKTGGNLTEDSVKYLRGNITFIQASDVQSGVTKRALSAMRLFARDDDAKNTTSGPTQNHVVQGIQGFVEPLIIPKSNTFMTVLLVFSIVIAVIIVGILLFKLILELWAMAGTLGKTLNNFRKRYWWVMAKTITNLILVLYGVWVLYCMYQFTRGDSWAAKVLAGVTLALFTGVLIFFSWKIWSLANQYKKVEGDASGLFENKETWRKYSIFYENYKKSYWWMFIPVIVYMFARGVIIAVGDGHGMFQVGGQLIVEGLMLALLVFVRPYTHKSSNWITITIQVVRVLSVLCILVFVEQLHVQQTPKTVVGLVLVIMQSVLTGLLAILIVVNAMTHWCRTNTHVKARKEAEKHGSRDSLITPLGTRESLLMTNKNQWGGRDDTSYHGSYSDAHEIKNVPSTDGRFEHMRKPSEPLLPNLGNPQGYGQQQSYNNRW